MLCKAMRPGEIIQEMNVNRQDKGSEAWAQCKLEDEKEPAKETEKQQPGKVEGHQKSTVLKTK